MLWNLKWGAQISTLLEIAETTGAQPRALQERPLLRVDCWEYLEAFNEISDQRGYNESGVQPLAVSDITAYLTDGLGLSRGERKTQFLRHMLKMDRTYMSHVYEKQSSARKAT